MRAPTRPQHDRAAPFRPRDYAQDDPDVRFWDEPIWDAPPPRAFFVDEVDAQIDADLRGVTRAMLLGFVCGIIGAALIWWWQS